MKGGYLNSFRGRWLLQPMPSRGSAKPTAATMYNVKNQDSLYTEAITDIWNRQRESLQDAQEHDDEDVVMQEDEDERFCAALSQAAATPAVAEGMSQISQSAASALNRRS